MTSVQEKYSFRTCCVQKLFWMSETISVHNMFSPGLSLEFSCIELVIQWTICRHIKTFWQRFTCTIHILLLSNIWMVPYVNKYVVLSMRVIATLPFKTFELCLILFLSIFMKTCQHTTKEMSFCDPPFFSYVPKNSVFCLVKSS